MSDKMNDDLIRFPEVHRLTGRCRTGVWELERAGKFPRRKHIDTTRKTYWSRCEVLAWVAEKMAEAGEKAA